MPVVCGRLSGSGLCLCWIAVFHVVQAATLRKPHSTDATHICKIVSVMRKENGSLSRMALPLLGDRFTSAKTGRVIPCSCHVEAIDSNPESQLSGVFCFSVASIHAATSHTA